MRPLALLALVAFATPALAVPTTMHHQGRLLDSSGLAINGDHDLTLAIYDVDSGGTALWQETVTASFDSGYFAETFGLTTALDAAIFADDELYAGLTVDSGSELAPRIRLDSVAFAFAADHALTADTATNVSGGSVDATEVTIGGTTVIDSSGMIDFSRIANPTVGTHTHAASDVTLGQFDVARIPVGTGVDTIAAGDHTHDISNLNGNLDASRLTGSVPTSMLTGSIDASTLTGSIPASALPASIVLGDNTDTCDSSLLGALRYAGSAFEGCTEDGWKPFLASTPSGSSPADAGQTCQVLLTGNASLPDGVYWLDPDGSGPTSPFEAYCDMTTDGGGWTLVGLANGAGELSTADYSADVTDPTTGNYVKPLTGATGTHSRFECGSVGTGVLGEQYMEGSWSWAGTHISATMNAPYNENVTWRAMVPGYDPPGGEADSAWGNHVGGVHYPNFGYTGFSAIDNRIFRQGVFTCNPQGAVYGNGDTAWAATTGQRYVRYWLK